MVLQLFNVYQLVLLCKFNLLNEKLEPVFPLQLTYLKLFELSWVFENNVTVQRFNFNDYFYLLLDADNAL